MYKVQGEYGLGGESLCSLHSVLLWILLVIYLQLYWASRTETMCLSFFCSSMKNGWSEAEKYSRHLLSSLWFASVVLHAPHPQVSTEAVKRMKGRVWSATSTSENAFIVLTGFFFPTFWASESRWSPPTPGCHGNASSPFCFSGYATRNHDNYISLQATVISRRNKPQLVAAKRCQS